MPGLMVRASKLSFLMIFLIREGAIQKVYQLLRGEGVGQNGNFRTSYLLNDIKALSRQV